MAFLPVWSPLVSAFGAVALALLLVASRAHLRHAVLFVASGALLALLVAMMAIFTTLLVALGTGGPAHNGLQLIGLGAAVFQVADDVTTLLTFAAWSLLLYAAIQAGSRWRLVVLTLLFTGTSALASAVMTPQIPLLDGLRDWLIAASAPDGHWGEALLIAAAHLTTLAALVGTLLLSAEPSGISGPRCSGWRFL